MSTAMRSFWLVTLVIFSGGCSSYKMVSSPRIQDETKIAVGWESSVKVGDEVRITLANNGKVEGRIRSISFEALTLEPVEPSKHTKYTENIPSDILPRVIAADSIQVLEKRGASAGKTWLLIGGILVGTVGLLGIAIGLSGGMNM